MLLGHFYFYFICGLHNLSPIYFLSLSGEIPMVNSSIGPNCCTCNCQSTLQAILQELKTMRKLIQIQSGTMTSPMSVRNWCFLVQRNSLVERRLPGDSEKPWLFPALIVPSEICTGSVEM